MSQKIGTKQGQKRWAIKKVGGKRRAIKNQIKKGEDNKTLSQKMKRAKKTLTKRQ
jgi:hypothetical protein